jgi:hypothetical protein
MANEYLKCPRCGTKYSWKERLHPQVDNPPELMKEYTVFCNTEGCGAIMDIIASEKGDVYEVPAHTETNIIPRFKLGFLSMGKKPIVHEIKPREIIIQKYKFVQVYLRSDTVKPNVKNS